MDIVYAVSKQTWRCRLSALLLTSKRKHSFLACARVLPEMVELLRMTCSRDSAEIGLSRSFRETLAGSIAISSITLPESWNSDREVIGSFRMSYRKTLDIS